MNIAPLRRARSSRTRCDLPHEQALPLVFRLIASKHSRAGSAGASPSQNHRRDADAPPLPFYRYDEWHVQFGIT